MLKSDIRLIAPCAAQVSESPVWEASRRQLHFVDIYRARIGTIDWASGALSWIETPEPVGCVGPAGDGHFAAGLASGMVDRPMHAFWRLLDRAGQPAERRPLRARRTPFLGGLDGRDARPSRRPSLSGGY
jgi:sugar lactone lactonase YvrE